MARDSRSVLDWKTLSFAIVALSLVEYSLALAGSAPIGILAGCVGTTIDGHEASSSSALFNGDTLRVNSDGLAVAKLTGGRQFVLGRDTVASLSQEANGLTLNLTEGRVSVQAAGGHALRVRTGDLLIEPVPGRSAVGDLALLDGRLSVVAKEGNFQLTGHGLLLRATRRSPINLDTHKLAQKPSGAGAAGAAAGGNGAAKAIGIGAATAASPIAIARVAAHAPPQACENAASPSVPATACGSH